MSGLRISHASPLSMREKRWRYLSSVSKGPQIPLEERGGLKLQESAQNSRFLKPAELYSGGGGLTAGACGTTNDSVRCSCAVAN